MKFNFFKNIRSQLTFYFVLIFGVMLCIFSVTLYTVVKREDRIEFDKAMVVVARSANDYLETQDYRPEKSNEFTNTFIPFSARLQQYIKVFDISGNLIFKLRDIDFKINQELFEKALDGNTAFENSEEKFKDEENEQHPLRVLYYPESHNSKKYVIVVAVSLSNLEKTLYKFRLMLYIAIPFTLILSGVFGWIFSKKVYAPVNQLIQKSNEITANNLGTKLPVADTGDEISELAVTLNTMMERLEKSFLILKQFTSDASHELRTPLTILKSEIEVALNKERSVSEYERVLKVNLEEVERLRKIVDGLLTLTHIESGKIEIGIERINLDELLIEAVSKIDYLAKKKNIKVILKFNELKDEEYKQLHILGDGSKLLNVFINLLDNAVKYTDPDGEIVCTENLSPSKSNVVITIQDNGVGIPNDILENVFIRFFRADISRSRMTNTGIGLGLAITKSVIEAHDGKIYVASILGKGTTFTIVLPVTE